MQDVTQNALHSSYNQFGLKQFMIFYEQFANSTLHTQVCSLLKYIKGFNAVSNQIIGPKLFYFPRLLRYTERHNMLQHTFLFMKTLQFY